MAYSVSLKGTWTVDGKATPEFFESKGASVKKSRTHGDFQVFIGGQMVAWIFNSQAGQKQFLQERGLL